MSFRHFTCSCLGWMTDNTEGRIGEECHSTVPLPDGKIVLITNETKINVMNVVNSYIYYKIT